MGNAIASCFARSVTTAAASSSATGGAASPPRNFCSPHSDAINCIVAAGADAFLSCSDDKTVSETHLSNGCAVKRCVVDYAVQRCWWGNDQLSLSADRGGRVSWLVNRDGCFHVAGAGAHKLTVNALAGDMSQVCVV